MSANSQGSDDDFVDPLANYEPQEYDDPLEEALAEKSVTEIEGRPYIAVPATTTVKQCSANSPARTSLVYLLKKTGNSSESSATATFWIKSPSSSRRRKIGPFAT